MITYDLSKIPSYLDVCYIRMRRERILELHGAVTDEWHDDPNQPGVLYRLSNITQALIDSSPHVGIGSITVDNAEEFLYRLDQLYDADIPFLFTMTIEGRCPVRITMRDVSKHTGLSTAAKPLSIEHFDNYIRLIRKNRQRSEQDGYEL